MFDFLKKKFLGEEVLTVWIPSVLRTRVYVWKHKSKYSLRIRSERGSYARGMAGNYTSVWFEPSEVQGLIDAIADANTQMTKLMQKA